MPKILTSIWNNLDGAKTYIGLIVTLLGFLVAWIPDAMGAVNADPALVTKIVGVLTTILGLLFKVQKAMKSTAQDTPAAPPA